jgi:hypothetical protein
MAELYAKPFETIETGYNPQQPQGGGQQGNMEAYLSSLPPEERQAAIERLNAPLTGEELAMLANSGKKIPNIEEFAEIEKWHKSHEISFIDGLGKIAEGGEQVMTDLSNAFGAMFSDPADVASKMPATATEAFAQGTRNFYGMLAQSSNTDSVLFRVKDFLNGTGTIEDRYNQYIEALKFTKDSADLAEGKTTMVMDKDMINHEVTQAMAYIADPTLFIPFGKVASTGLRAVGLGEKLTLAGARAAAIKNGIIGNTIKWGVGLPLEFLGGAVRNTIDFGLDKAGQAFEATTGIGAKEFAQTARMSGIGFSASAIAGHAVPYASTISDAYLVGSSAKGFGEALTLVGETMSKNKFGRGINSWAAEALEQAEKSGVALSPHAKGLLKTLNAVDPFFAYGWNGLETAAEGALIGGGLGYASGNAEGMYSGIGAGIALGAVGGTAGKVVSDVTGGTGVARRAVQAKMVIEGHKGLGTESSMRKAIFFEAMQKATEARGQDVDLVNGIIAGIDKVAPNFEFHAMTPEQFAVEALRKGYNPETGKFLELSAIDQEFGGDRASKSRAMYVLRSIGGDFVGDSKAFLKAIKRASAKDSANPSKPAANIPLVLRKYIDVAKTFDKLTKTQQDAILKEIDAQGDLAKELGGSTRLREHYDALSWSEAWTDSLVKKFETDREGARKDIVDMLAQETKKDGKMTKKGKALVDKLRNEGFLDRDGKLLRERNLLQADMTYMEFSATKGGVIRREADGKTHMYINLNKMGSETFPHELFHTIMRESPMKDHFTKSLIQKLVGSFDDQGNLVRSGEINVNQLRKFFKKYIDLTSFDEDGTMNPVKAEETMKAVDTALAEYEQTGKNKKISDKSRALLEHYTEEFGAYYFSHWLMGRNRNTLFFGGELKGVEGLVERIKDSFLGFWQSKISKTSPMFDFSEGLNASFDRSGGLGRIASIDYFMRDMVRAASNANRESFRPDSMTLENLRDFERSNGLRNLTTQDGNRRLNPREQVTQNTRLGKEAYRILSGLDKNLRTSKDTIDENGKPVITGRLSEAELDALVKGGIVPRAWADKVNQGYAMLDGTVSNIFSAGYLGKTEQTTDASYPRKTGKDVAFKNRKAVLFAIDTKIKADGTFYTLFHTLDLAVIEQRGNHLWQNTEYRNLWNGDRGAMEADFFRYISNASKASTDITKQDSAVLLEKSDGLGAQRRDVLHQMAGMALQTGDAYKHQPIAVIPEGIRHSVTTFNIDGMTTPRIEQGARYDIDMGNAHKFIRENWQPDDMRQEKTPVGRVFTHESGFKFTQDANGKVSAYTSTGDKIGTFNSIKEATVAGKNKFNNVYKNHDAEVKKVFEKKNEEAKKFQALDENERQEAIRNGDLFSLKRVREFIKNRKVLRQSREEYIVSKAIEAVENPELLTKAVNDAIIKTRSFFEEYRNARKAYSEAKDKDHKLMLERNSLHSMFLKTTSAEERFAISQRIQENNNQSQAIAVEALKAERELDKIEKRLNKERVDAFVELQYAMIHLNPEQFIEVVKNELMNTYNPVRGGKYQAIRKAHTGIAETLFAEGFDAQTKTGVPIVVVGTHGTRNVELMISRILLDEKLGSRYGTAAGGTAYSSDLGHFMGGSTDTSSAYAGMPPYAFTEYAKNGIPIHALVEFLTDGAGLNSGDLESTHPINRLKKAIFELKKNSQKVNSDLLYRATDAYMELFDKGDKLSYEEALAKSREVQGILAYLKDIGYIKARAHLTLLGFAIEAFDMSVRKEKPDPLSREEFNYHINNADDLVIDSAFYPLNEVRVTVDELLGGGLKNQDKEVKIPNEKPIKIRYDSELYKEVIKLSQETINSLTDTKGGWMGKTNFENKIKMVIAGKKFSEGSSSVDISKTWMHARMLMAFDNPKVIIDPRGYDEKKLAPQMIQAMNEGHDGIIFKRLRDGGSADDIYIQLKGNQDKILTIDTSFDSEHIPRKDENGNVLKTGRDIGLALQPDEPNAPKRVQGIQLDMTKAYDVFRKEYEESTGQSWSQDKFMQRARNWQFFGDENGFVAVRPQRSGFVKLVGMAGDNKSKLRGIQQIQQQGLPIWGMVSKEIKDMAIKRGMREPNMIERTVLKQALNSAALGDAEILGYTSDNGVRLRYPDIGEVTKYMIGSQEYYQKLRSDFGDQIKSKIGFQPDEPSIIGIEEIAEARRIGNLFKTKGMQEFIGDREVVPQTADEGFTDFINRLKEANFNQQDALYVLDEMSKAMFGGLDRQMLRVRRQELIDRNPDAKNAVRGMEWKRMSLQDASEFKKIEAELDKPAPKEKKHSDFTAGVARDFAEKISKAKEWVKKASPTYNDFSGYIADNVPMREYYQHAVYSSKFKTGQPVAVVGVHGTYTSQGFLKDKKYKHELRIQDYPLEKGEMRGAYFASSDSTVLNPEYQGYDPKKLGYEVDPTFRKPESDKPNIAKSVIRFDNPLVVNGQFADIMKRTEKILGEAIEKGHDGVIYINQMDGGNLDVSFIVPADKANQHQRMIGSTREKYLEGSSYEPLPRGEGLTNRTANLQPNEPTQGGRTYDPKSKEFRTKFIGKWAEENPDRLKGYNIEFIDRGSMGGYRNPNAQNVRIRMQDNSNKANTIDVGHITAQIDHSQKTATLSSNIAPEYRGNKLSYALYSEMAERLRSMGVKYVDGQVVNPEGIPIKVREKIIGDTRMIGRDGSFQNARPVSQEQGSKIIKRKQASGGEWEGIDVVNELDFNARYQPDEGDNYRGSHKAPSGENGEGSLDAMDRTYPEDLYSTNGARYYGDGQPKLDQQMHELIMKFRGKPDAMVTVYRAVPKGKGSSINAGDWVTPLRAYAFMHGERWNEGANILEKKVRAGELFTEGNSMYEFGWSPDNKNKGKTSLQPDDYQGGDDYYKKGKRKDGVKIPKQYKDWPTSPEGVDEFGAKIRYVRYFDPKSGQIKEVENFPFTYMEIGHEINSKNVFLWSLNNANFKKYGVHENSPITIGSMASMMRDKQSPFHGYGNQSLSDVRGRIEMPVLDEKGNITEKGRVSIGVLAGAEGKVTLPQFRLLKEKIIESLGLPALTEKDFDFWLYTADRDIRSQFGLSEKDKGGIKFQPAEYTQFTTEQTASGRILKNAKGYAIILANNKFRVYNPTKAIIGVYNSEEEAKKRIYKEMPKR